MIRPLFRLARDLHRYLTFGTGFRGVFDSFAEARAAVPRGGKVGFDYPELANRYRETAAGMHNVDSTEYPIVHHLQRTLRQRATVLDVGGTVGEHYLRLRTRLGLDGVRWIVWDMPSMVALGQEVCAGLPNVSFIRGPAALAGMHVDVLLANGSLHYFETLPFRALAEMGIRPQHLVTDGLPVHDGRSFVTLQCLIDGRVYHPFRVFNRDDYLREARDAGYEVADTWTHSVEAGAIPFHRAKSFGYEGFLLSRRRGASLAQANAA